MDDHKSIQDLIPPARPKPVRPVTTREEITPPVLPPNPRSSKGRGGGKWIGILIGLVVLVIIAFTIASTVFHRAAVTVTLHSYSIPVSGSFEASPTGVNLAFTTKSAEEHLSKTVASTGSTHAEDVASGTITVSNSATKAQKLIATTRFESKDGHMYRIKTPVTVPAHGTADATIYADQAGEAYNMTGPIDFTLPGLKASPQYTTVTGHLSGAIAGGFVGDKPVVSDATRAQAVQELTTSVSDKARAALTATLGPDDVIFPGSITVSIATSPDQKTDAGAIITVTATASAPVFSGTQLAKLMSAEGGVTIVGPVQITNIDSLSATVSPSKTKGNVALSLSGTAKLMGSYDKAALMTALAGKNRRDVGAALAKYPAIEDMQIAVYPFWEQSLPTDEGRITVSEKTVQ